MISTVWLAKNKRFLSFTLLLTCAYLYTDIKHERRTSSVKDKKHDNNRVFVCITGQVGRLILKKKLETFFQPLLDEGFIPDIALVVSENSKIEFVNPQTRGKNSQSQFKSFEEARNFLVAQNLKVINKEPFNSEESPKIPVSYLSNLNKRYMSKDRREKRSQIHVKQFQHLSNCENAMISSGSKPENYIFGVRMRDDVSFMKPISFQDILSEKLEPKTVAAMDCRTWGGLNDRLAVISPDSMHTYFNVPKDNIYNKDMKGVRDPESFICKTYKENGLKVKSTNKLRFVMRYWVDEDGKEKENRSDAEHKFCKK